MFVLLKAALKRRKYDGKEVYKAYIHVNVLTKTP